MEGEQRKLVTPPCEGRVFHTTQALNQCTSPFLGPAGLRARPGGVHRSISTFLPLRLALQVGVLSAGAGARPLGVRGQGTLGSSGRCLGGELVALAAAGRDKLGLLFCSLLSAWWSTAPPGSLCVRQAGGCCTAGASRPSEQSAT